MDGGVLHIELSRLLSFHPQCKLGLRSTVQSDASETAQVLNIGEVHSTFRLITSRQRSIFVHTRWSYIKARCNEEDLLSSGESLHREAKCYEVVKTHYLRTTKQKPLSRGGLVMMGGSRVCLVELEAVSQSDIKLNATPMSLKRWRWRKAIWCWLSQKHTDTAVLSWWSTSRVDG